MNFVQIYSLLSFGVIVIGILAAITSIYRRPEPFNEKKALYDAIVRFCDAKQINAITGYVLTKRAATESSISMNK